MTTIVAQASAKGIILSYTNQFVFGNNVPILLQGGGVGAIISVDDVNGTTQEISADGSTIISSVVSVLATGTITFAPNTPGISSFIQVANWAQQYNVVPLGNLTVAVNLGVTKWTYTNFQLLSAFPGYSANMRVQDKAWKWSAPLPVGPLYTDYLSFLSSLQAAANVL